MGVQNVVGTGYSVEAKTREMENLPEGCIKLLICCGGGFSSSAMAKKVKDGIKEKNLGDRIYADFQPFFLVSEIIDSFDIVMCCPHLQFHVDEYIAKNHPDKPFYMIPPRMYGVMEIKDVLADAEDIIALFKETGDNPTHFADESELHKIRRYQAHRRLYRGG